MNIKKTAVLTLPILAALSVNAYANQQDTEDNHQTASYNMQSDQQNNQQTLIGQVAYIHDNRFGLDQYSYESKTIHIDENTIVFRDKEIVSISDIAQNQQVVVIVEDDHAKVVLIRESGQYNVYIGNFTKQGYNEQASLVSDTGTISLPIDNQYSVFDIHGNETGQYLTDFTNHRLIVVYSDLTAGDFGIPYSAKIVFLPQGEHGPAEIPSLVNLIPPIFPQQVIPTPMPEPEPIPQPTPGTTLLAQLPWWAGGLLGNAPQSAPQPAVQPEEVLHNFHIPEIAEELHHNFDIPDIIEEILEEIIDESYYTGVEIIVEDGEIIIGLS